MNKISKDSFLAENGKIRITGQTSNAFDDFLSRILNASLSFN